MPRNIYDIKHVMKTEDKKKSIKKNRWGDIWENIYIPQQGKGYIFFWRIFLHQKSKKKNVQF